MEYDAKVKRATFINRSVEVRETFKFASPVEVLHSLKVYCSSFYGCMLWDLAGNGAEQVFNAWTTAVKLSWAVPRATRTYLVQQVLSAGLTSAKVDILARFGNFFRSLRLSPCYEVAVMANLVGRDIRSITGSNIRLVQDSSGLDPWVTSPAHLKAGLIAKQQVNIEREDMWRVKYLGTLLGQRQELHYLGYETEKLRVNELIDSLCLN